jgi:serine-protein kinase ATM
MAQNLTAIIAGLQSDKVKSRQDALVLMDEALTNNDFVDRLASVSGSSKRWLAVFQALFVAVSMEKTNCVKKGLHKATAVSITRLEKAGSVVRNATERNVTLLPYKVVQALLEHLMNTMVDRARDRLLAPVSLNYIKSIVVICSHNPHLDHLEPDLWVSLVSLAFAVILETSLASPRGFLETSVDESRTQFDMDIDDPSVDTAGDDNEGPIGSKRARPHSPQPNLQRPSNSRPPTESTRTMSQEQIEFMGLLVILLQSPQAPYLKPGIAQNILDRIHYFFDMFPTWSIAHTNAVVSVNLIFSQLELNMTKICTDFALKMWSPLLSYWNGKEKKDKVVREELVVTMMNFFHLVTVPNVAEVARNRVQERVTEFYQCLQEDIDRSIFESLPLDSLRLHLRHPSDVNTVFNAVTFRSGYKFDPPHALSWAILELHADCARAVCVIYDDIPTRPVLSIFFSFICIPKDMTDEHSPNGGDVNQPWQISYP